MWTDPFGELSTPPLVASGGRRASSLIQMRQCHEQSPRPRIPYGGRIARPDDRGHRYQHSDASLAYILSSVRDHTLLGPAYQSKLKMQKPATAKALLAGCWKLFEGHLYT